MQRVLSLIGLLAGLGGGTVLAQTPTAPNPSIEAFKSICLTARAEPAATAKAAVAAHWSPIPAIAIAGMGGTVFQDAVGYRAPSNGALKGRGAETGSEGVWVIIGRTPMPGFSYLADSCAVFAAPADASLAQAVRTWAGGAPTVDDPAQQLIQYAFTESADQATSTAAQSRSLVTDSIETAAPGLQAGTISLVTVVPGAKRSVLVYSVVNP
jgi:hypothetical protein